MIRFSIPGEPVAKGRAKVSTFGGKVRLRTPEKTLNYESRVALFGSQAMAGRPPLVGAVSLTIVAHFQIPAGWSKKRRAAHAESPEYVVKRPDQDNIAKAICDGLNGIVWVDDCQVAMCLTTKVYGETPHVSVVIDQLGGAECLERRAARKAGAT